MRADALMRGFRDIRRCTSPKAITARPARRGRADLARADGRLRADRFIAWLSQTRRSRFFLQQDGEDLAATPRQSFLSGLEQNGMPAHPGRSTPVHAGRVSMFLDGRWFEFSLAGPASGAPRHETLDVEVLQQNVLARCCASATPEQTSA
jgi:hypothetical protein